MASRSVSMAGLSSQGGGISGGGVPFLIESASRATVSMISGGGRVPARPSAIVASAIRWLAFSAASSRDRLPVQAGRGGPGRQQLVVGGVERGGQRLPPGGEARRSRPRAAARPARRTPRPRRAVPCRTATRSQPGRIRISAQMTPARNPAAVCQTGRSAPTGPAPSEVYTSSCSPVTEPMSPTRAEHAGHARDHDQGHHGEPAVTVGNRSDGQPGRAAEHRRAADPLDPAQVRAAGVGQRAEQAARRGQHAERAPCPAQAPPTAARRSPAPRGSCPATAPAPAAAAPPRPASRAPPSPA